MKLDRDLSANMCGENVAVLHGFLRLLPEYNIPPEEKDRQYFGPVTRAAVVDFQEKHRLEATGVVNDCTAAAIGAAVDTQQPRRFLVRGRLSLRNGGALPPGIIVRAYDQDLRDQQSLAEDKRDPYEIIYTEEQFRHAEKGTADLLVKAFSADGIELGVSDVLFNAPTVATIDLLIATPDELALSEYERDTRDFRIPLDGLELADLSANQIRILAGEASKDRERVELYVNAAQLARQTGISPAVFYGFGRQNLPLELNRLLAVSSPFLRQALMTALADRIIPAMLRDLLEEIMQRIERLKLERAAPVPHELVGQLLNQEGGAPLAGFTVRGFDLDAGAGSLGLGYDLTNSRGLFAVTYMTSKGAAPDAERRLRLDVLNPQGQMIHQAEIRARADQQPIVEVRVPVTAPPEPPSLTLAELDATVHLELPPQLVSALGELGIRTLADIRKAGGLSHLALPVEPDHLAVKALEAYANLSLLLPDVKSSAAVIGKGYMSFTKIARTSPAAFVSATHEALGDFKAAQFHLVVRSVNHLLDDTAMMYKSAKSSGYQYKEDPDSATVLQQVASNNCECEDCEAAVSPLAYLADLLSYAVGHLEYDGAAIDLDFLTKTFHQPFGDLPTSCEDVSQQIRQVRICVEVLRSHFASTQKQLPASSLKDYLVQAYNTLLTKLGTSYGEIRLAKTADLSARRTLADRLGVDLDLAGPDHLGALLLDPPGQSGQSQPLSEMALEQLFGLVDTTRDPLSDGAKVGDVQNQITRWTLRGVEWARNADRDGVIYVSIKHPQASVAQVDLYRDAQKTALYLVASGTGPIAKPIAVIEKNGSDLSGTFDLASSAANEAIQIFAVPRLLSWRLQHLRTLWKQQDWPSDLYAEGQAAVELKQLPQGLQFPAAVAAKIHYSGENQVLVFDGVMSDAERGALMAASNEPVYARAVNLLYRRSQRLAVVDPDLIGPDDFRVPLPKANAADPDQAFDLWLKRRAWIDARLNELSALRTATSSKVSLEELPAGIQFPASLQGAIAYEPAFEALIFTGVMTEAQRDLLLSVSPDAAYQDAVVALFKASQQPPFDMPDLAAMLTKMYEPVAYGVTTKAAWSAETTVEDLNVLSDKLIAGVDVEDIVARIEDGLNLTVDSFTRLLAIRAKNEVAVVDPQSEQVRPEEWSEVLSILVQSRKASMLPAWYAEEHATSLRFDQTAFWISLREPKEGPWPPVLPAPAEQRPIIDPESLESNDLPELLAGRRAVILWEERRTRLAHIKEELKTAHQDQGFEAMLSHALGEPGMTDPLPLPPGVTISTLLTALNSNDPAQVSAAQETIASVYHMTAERFTRLNTVATKDHAVASDWAEVYAILTTAQKAHREFPAWVAEEQQAGLITEYWRALKAALPHWRASAEGRAGWQQALRTRSSAPLIDPDLLISADFRDPFANRPAFHRKQERADWIKAQLIGLAAGPDSLPMLDTIVRENLIGPEVTAGTRADLKAMREVSGLEDVVKQLWGSPLPDLHSLLTDLTTGSEAVAAEAGKTVATSLYLAVDDFAAFMSVWDKVTANSPVTSAEWDLVDEILTRSALSKSVFSLSDERQRGDDITGRLDQLSLDTDAFAYLRFARDLLAGNAPLLDLEREGVRAILVQAKKRRAFAEWKRQEQDDGLVLGPDDFQMPPPGPVQYPPKPAASLPEWRASWRARRDWQDSLQSRIDQAQAVIDGFRATVDDAEAATLPLLRDALIVAPLPDTFLDTKASAIADLLLIDAKTAACQITTRVAQAIETLQILLFGARAHELDAHPKLSLDAPDFDEEWKWLGSYATWRAAMFVYLYPENIALPSLRKRERRTPAFQKLLDTVRGNRRFDPEAACAAAREYAVYFRDVCNLIVEATCCAKARVDAGDCRSDTTGQPAYRDLFYLFARSTVTNTLYCSAFDVAVSTAHGQSFWEALPGPNKLRLERIVGAVPYERNKDERCLYVFAQTTKDGRPGLAYITYDLEKPSWADDWEELELDLPEKTLIGGTPSDKTGAAVANQTVQGILLVQRTWSDKPPTLAIDARCEVLKGSFVHEVYARSLDASGSAWEPARKDIGVQTEFSSDWDAFRLIQTNENNPGHNSTAHRALQVWVDEPEKTGSHYSWMLCLEDDVTYQSIVLEVHADGQHLQSWPVAGKFRGATPSQHDPAAVIIFAASPNSFSQVVAANKADLGLATPHVAGLEQVVPDSCAYVGGAPGHRRLIYQLTSTGQAVGSFYQFAFDTSFVYTGPDEPPSEPWSEASRTKAAPLVEDTGSDSSPSFAFDITEELSPAELQVRRDTIATWYPENTPEGQGSAANLTYLQEAYYFGPVQIAFQLQRNGFYQEALDWHRSVYDYTTKISDAKIWYGLKDEHDLPPLSPRSEDWLLDPLDPHSIAAARRDTYTRFTLFSIIRCLLEFADAEFTRDTAESVPRARMLYLMALKLLKRNEIKKGPNECKEVVIALESANIDKEQIYLLQQNILILNDSALVKQVTQKAQAALNGGGGFAQAWDIVTETKAEMPAAPRLGTIVKGQEALSDRAHAALLSRPNLVAAVGRASDKIANDYQYAMERLTGLSGSALAKADLPWLRGIASTDNGAMHAMSGKVDMGAKSPESIPQISKYGPSGYVPAPFYSFCIPANPIPEALRLHAELNLFKIRNCRNIAGMRRQLDLYAAPTDTVSGLPLIGADGQLVLPGLARLAPTAYRYAVMIERAKQLVGVAQQVEAAFLTALEKADDARYGLLRARQDLGLARAGVRLQNLRAQEAQSGVTLAQLQQDRAQIQLDHYQELLDEGMSDLEGWAITFMVSAAVHHTAAAAAAGFEASASGVESSAAAAASTIASIFSAYAAYERRRQDWEFQKSLAQQDVLIGAQNVKIAQDHVRVVGQEQIIAKMQTDNAESVVEFLQNKFTNRELYDWMSEVLERVYSFFLQQATAMAQLAANQLAFERQEAPPPVIQGDYWDAPSDDSMSGADAKAPDRRGLTGSARLLRDIYQLDQYAFDTDKRKLQLSKTISLAQFPAEFQRFRETGVMIFTTPMELFDRDFPGHYLRLVKKVRVAYVALISPEQGIHATLSTTGTSRVVIGGDIYQSVVANAGPQLVALSSPRDASGQFELEEQPGMLRPFEGMGVDTTWELRMPRAANLFVDYRTIANVLVTIEYTALNSFDYYQQVIQTLRPTVSANRAFSFRHQFADQWYDFHNPDLTTTPMTVRFSTLRDDFPPNLKNLRIQHLVLYFARADGQTFEIPVSHLHFTELGAQGSIGGGASSIDGIISTLKGNAGSWTSMIGKTPTGEWELALPNTQDLKDRFQKDQIEDMLFAVTYSGRTPEWPA